MSDRAIDRLSRLLEVERAALLKGDFDAVGALIEEKEELVKRFDAAGADELRLLSGALLRNGRLLEAAQEGVATVVTTLEKQKQARTTLTSYDANGKTRQIAQPERGTERRF